MRSPTSPRCARLRVAPGRAAREDHGAHPRDRKAGGRRERSRSSTRYETTVGRALLSEILPPGLAFENINKPLKKKEISRLINSSFRRCGLRETVIFADKLMQAGYALATRGGISFAAGDMLVPIEKKAIIEKSEKEVKEIEAQYTSGLVTQGERYNKVVDIWGRAGDEIAKAMMNQLGEMETVDRKGNKVSSRRSTRSS